MFERVEELSNPHVRKPDDPVLEVKVGKSPRVPVTPYIFRSWSGARFVDGEPYDGPVYVLGSNDVAEGQTVYTRKEES